jgi:hypothetical protein
VRSFSIEDLGINFNKTISVLISVKIEKLKIKEKLPYFQT